MIAYVCEGVCVYACVCVHVCACVCLCVCVWHTHMPLLYIEDYRSLLQNIVSFIGLFCKRDL